MSKSRNNGSTTQTLNAVKQPQEFSDLLTIASDPKKTSQVAVIRADLVTQ